MFTCIATPQCSIMFGGGGLSLVDLLLVAVVTTGSQVGNFNALV